MWPLAAATKLMNKIKHAFVSAEDFFPEILFDQVNNLSILEYQLAATIQLILHARVIATAAAI